MNLHLLSNSDNFSIDCSDDECRLVWRVHLDLSAYNTLSLTDFRIRPAILANATKFSLVSCNLVKSDITNPAATVLVTTSFINAIKIPGLYIIYVTNLSFYSDKFALDRTNVDEIIFTLQNAKLFPSSDVKISINLTNEVQN